MSRVALLCVCAALLSAAVAVDPHQKQQFSSWRRGRFCIKHPVNCRLMELALPGLLGRLSKRLELKSINSRDVFRLSVLALLRHGPGKSVDTSATLGSLIERDIVGMLQPLASPVDESAIAAVAATVTRNTPACYSVSGHQLRAAWTVYVNFATGQPKLRPSLADFQMRVQIQSAMEAWRQPTFSLPRWISMLWIDGMRQSLLQRAQCGVKKQA
nr:adult cement protein 18 [Chelonibia testudinaria]